MDRYCVQFSKTASTGLSPLKRIIHPQYSFEIQSWRQHQYVQRYHLCVKIALYNKSIRSITKFEHIKTTTRPINLIPQHYIQNKPSVMQSSKQNPNQKNLIKQSMQSIKKTIVPFNQELLNLQKKIQEVQNKNQLILQKIHKAYDFKKTKNKVFYDASEQQPDHHQLIPTALTQNLSTRDRVSLQYRIGQGYASGVQDRPQSQHMREFQSQPREVQYQQRQFQSLQRQQQLQGKMEQQQSQFRDYQPREFQAESGTKTQNARPSTPQLPQLHFASRYSQPLAHKNQGQQLFTGLSSGNNLTSQMREQSQSQQATSRVQVFLSQHGHINPNHQPHPHPRQQMDESQQQVDFQSHSNYSDIDTRKRIKQNFRRREKDFSDIKSTIEDRGNMHWGQYERRGRVNKLTPKKSFVFSAVENNSSYSEGNLPNSGELIQGDDLQPIDSPITNQPFFPNSHSAYPESIPNFQSRNVHVYSTNQIYPTHSYIQQGPMSSVPTIPLQSMQMSHSVLPNRTYQQQAISQNQINYLADMYKTQRQKTITLEKQLQQKDQNIQHLKMYKKSFRKFRDLTFHLFDQAFEQYVENFLRNRLYQIERAMRKNQNRLAALIMQLKDFNDERTFNLSLRKTFPEKMNKRSHSSLQPGQNPRHNFFQQKVPDEAFEQNVSTISNRSGDRRSVSARKRPSQDKSITKKSNQSQHLIMKKEFTNIAQNYQTMIKVKNEEIERYENQTKQLKSTIQTLQDENNRLKTTCQHLQSQIQNQITTINGQSQLTKRNSGNLRILSRSSSRSQIKKSPSPVDQTEQLNERLKSYTKTIEKMSEQNSLLEGQLEAIHHEHLACQEEIKLMAERLFDYEQKVVPLKDEKILSLEVTATKLTKDCQAMVNKVAEISAEGDALRGYLAEKDKKILELDSALYVKNSQLKKTQNLLTLKTYKLEEFNKLLLPGSTNEPLNDSVCSVIEEPHNKTTLLMLEHLEKQLEDQKHQKEVEFVKLKRSYETKIEQLKNQFQEIVLQNENLAEKLSAINLKQRQLQYEKEELNQTNLKLKEQIEKLQAQIAFLNQQNNFYQAQRHTGKTGFFGVGDNSENILQNQLSQSNLRSTGNNQLLKPLQFEEQDFDDFNQIERSQASQRKQNSLPSWKPASGQIQLLDESSCQSVNNKRTPSENNLNDPKHTALNYNVQHKLSTLKQENIQLSQKVAKFEKQNKYLKETEEELNQKYEHLKIQLTNFSAKYNQLETNNSELIRMLQQTEADKIQLEKQKKQLQAHHSNAHTQHTGSHVDWKEVEKQIEPVELKGSGIYSPWSFAEKDDLLLDRSSKQITENRDSKQINKPDQDFDKRKETDNRDLLVSAFGLMNRPSKESRESLSSLDKKIDDLTKKLGETELLLENKEKINEELVIGFTKKIDKLTTQYEDQAKEQGKAIEKYIQENSRLRRDKERLEEEIQALNMQMLKLESQQSSQPVVTSSQHPNPNTQRQHQLSQENHIDNENLLEQSEQAQQIDLNENQQGEQDGFGMLEQRIQEFNGKGFMLGLNHDDQQQQIFTQNEQQQAHTKPSKRPTKFASILEEDDDQPEFDDFEEQPQKIDFLEKQVRELQQSVQQLQTYLEETLNKVKQKEQDKFTLVQELQKKNHELEELRDLLQLKQTGKSHTLTLSKSINYGHAQRSSIEKSDRPRLNSITSLRYSRTLHGERKSSFEEQINFEFLDQSNPNNRSILQNSHMSNMYSENMSMIFEKEQNFLEQIRKAKNKRKEEGKLLRKTFEYIKKLRASLNQKNKKIKILEMRVEELRDNCWLWKKNSEGQPGSAMGNSTMNNASGTRFNQSTMHNFATNNSGVQPSVSPRAQQNDHSYLEHNNESLYESSRMVDSRLFECNSEDLNKKKPHRHNHYKKLEYDTKLIIEENRILTKQIQMLQEELIKIQQQQNGLMAVKQLYKEEIRALNKQNQELTSMHQLQLHKLHEKLQSSEGVHNFEAIKQLFKKIIDNIGVILYPNLSNEAKKKSPNLIKQQKRKQAEECIKVVCSILNYDEHIKNELSFRLSGQVTI